MSPVIELLSESPVAFTTMAFVIGLLVGSFLNVVIHRLPAMMEQAWQSDCAGPSETALAAAPYNLITPASACPACKTPIKARHNIPVISWLALKGQCAACQTSISARYPLVELLTGILSALVAWRFGFGIEALLALPITWTLIALTGIDVDKQLLPDILTLPLLWAGLIASVCFGRGLAAFPVDPQSAILGATFGYLSLWSIFHGFKLLTGKEGMGYGDFKLYAAFGAWMGWQLLIPVILFSAVAGTVIGLSLIALKRHERDVPIPFGPYLAIAGWLLMVYSDWLVTPWWSVPR